MNLNDLRHLVEARRSIRYYSDKPIGKDLVLNLLELAHNAPSVQNMQPWRFHVVNNAELRKRITDCCCYGNFAEGASTCIVVSCDMSKIDSMPDVIWNEKELEYSCMAAMTYVLLGATAAGIGSCWFSLHHGGAHEALELPQNERVVGGILLGNFKKGEEEPSGRPERRALKELVKFYD